MRLVDLDDPEFLLPDWVVTRPRLTGICGSDAKQVFMDWGNVATPDNPMKGFFSLPQVLGHEVVADVVALGPEAEGLEIGDRVVLNPWLSCRPRGVDPICPACEAGDLSLCWSFGVGPIAPGIHTGTSRDASGGYARAHARPRHAAVQGSRRGSGRARGLRRPVRGQPALDHPPSAGARRQGDGVRRRRPRYVRHRDPPHACIPTSRCSSSPASRPRLRWRASSARRSSGTSLRTPVIEEAASWSGGVLQPSDGLPMAYPGAIDVVYDTIGKQETFEVGARVLKARGTLVKAGVHGPTFWEDTPLYFKELSLVGSNAFGFEEVDGVRRHGIAHYLDLVREGRVDLTGMLTHTFVLDEWRDAFTALATQDRSAAIKIAFDMRPN